MILMTIFFFLGSILNRRWSGFYINVITKFGFLLFQVLFIPIPADSLYCNSYKFISPKHETLFSLDSTRD